MKMTFPGAEKAFCELQFHKCESIVIVHRRFRTQYHKSFINKTGLHLIFIIMPVGTSVMHFPIVGLDILLKMTLLPWPPRSPDLTPCDFLLWGYVNDDVFVPPMPLDLV